MYRFAQELMQNRYVSLLYGIVFFHALCLTFASARYAYYFNPAAALLFSLLSKYGNMFFSNGFSFSKLARPTTDNLITWGAGAALFLLWPRDLTFGYFKFDFYAQTLKYMLDLCAAADKYNFMGEIGGAVSLTVRYIVGLKPGNISLHPLGCLIMCFVGMLAEQLGIDLKWIKEGIVVLTYLKAVKGFDVFLKLSQRIFSLVTYFVK